MARRAGLPVISLSTPQFPAGDLAPFLSSPIYCQLGDPRGQPEARRLVSQRLFAHWPLADEEIILTGGAKSGLLVALLANVEPGSLAAIIEPSWPSYESIARAAGLNCVGVPTHYADRFGIDRELLDRHAAAASVIILSNPNNPSGRVYSPKEIDEVVDWCAGRGCWLVVDESFSLTSEDPEYFAKRSSWPYERMLVVNSVSKNFSLQGLRIGAIAGPVDAIEAMQRVQLGVLSPPSRPVQDILVQLGAVDRLVPLDLRRLRAITLDFVSECDGWECVPTRGTFYVFPKVERLRERVARWEQQASIFALAGHHFGQSYADHLRFCFYRPIEELHAIFSRLRALG